MRLSRLPSYASPRVRSILGAGLLSLTVGCGPLDPAARDAAAYVRALQPLTQENSVLAERTLQIAASYHDRELAPEQVYVAWRTDVVPLAEHLYDQAGFVDPPAGWAPRHDKLVAIWGGRANAYVQLGDAVATGNAAAFDRGEAAANDAKLQEEEWFKELNKVLGDYRITVQAYP